MKEKLTNIRLQITKRIKNTKKSVKILVITLLIIILFITSIFLLMLNSRPGDLFFTLKGFYEQYEISLAKANPSPVYLNILKDRVNALNSLASQNSCVQVLLAQDELSGTIKSIRSNNYDQKDLADITIALNQIGNTQTTCVINSSITALAQVYTDIKFANETAAQQKSDLIYEGNDLQNKYNTLNGQVQSANITTQDIINQIDSLLLIPKQAIDTFNGNLNNTGSYLIYKLNFDAGYLALTTLTSYMKSNTIDRSSNFEGEVGAICLMYATNSLCSKSNVASNWNSIYGKEILGNQISLGEGIYLTYLKLAVPTVTQK